MKPCLCEDLKYKTLWSLKEIHSLTGMIELKLFYRVSNAAASSSKHAGAELGQSQNNLGQFYSF